MSKKLIVLCCLLSTITCMNNPVENTNKSDLTIKFPEGRTLVYSLYEINQIDSTGLLDSSIGVFITRVGRSDSIRTTPVKRWVTNTYYFSGNSHPTDSLFVWYMYIQEADSFLYSLAYPSSYVKHIGQLMKRALCEQTDSISALGDSVLIENVEVKEFCTKPYVGKKWTMRPDWLEYECVKKETISIFNSNFDCFKISGMPLDSHMTVKNGSTYSQNSWVTSNKIIRTVISQSLPDSIWDYSNYIRIELIEDLNTTEPPLCNGYKERVIQRGWN